MLVVIEAKHDIVRSIPFVPWKTSIFSPLTFVEPTDQILTRSGVGAGSRSAAAMIARTQAKATIHRFHGALRGGLGGGSGVMVSGSVVFRCFLGNNVWRWPGFGH